MNTITVNDENREMFEVFCQMHPEEAFVGNKGEFMRYLKKINSRLTEELIEALFEEINTPKS